MEIDPQAHLDISMTIQYIVFAHVAHVRLGLSAALTATVTRSVHSR